MPGLSPGKSGEIGRPNPNRSTKRPRRSAPSRKPILTAPTLLDLISHLAERQHAVVVAAELVDHPVPDPQDARSGVDDCGRRHHALFDRGGRGDDLEGRARFVEVLDGAIAPRRFRRIREGVRIERRLVGHRQDLAGRGIQDDDRSAGGPVLDHARVQLALGDVLQVPVDGQLDRGAGGRRALDAAEDVPAAVGRDQDRAGLSANLRVVRRLDAAQPVAVDADVAERVRREALVGIEAAAFLDEPDAVELERRDAPRRVGRNLPFYVGERPLVLEALERAAGDRDSCTLRARRTARRPPAVCP